MPSTIPYDPSLTLGSIVPGASLTVLEKIAALQSENDGAEDLLNDYISMKNSLDMTIQELLDMEISEDALAQQAEGLNASIIKAATDYAQTKAGNLLQIQEQKAKIRTLNANYESIIDWTRTSIKPLALAFDTMKLNVQYFSFDDNEQSSDSTASAIKKFVSGEAGWLGTSVSGEIARSAQKQVHEQYQNHDLSGTLVISISATHKNANVFAPLIINVDKAIRIWNKMFPGDMINPSDYTSMSEIALEANTQAENTFNILSGVTYGSSFVGMIHFRNRTESSSYEAMISKAQDVQGQITWSDFISYASGGVDDDDNTSSDIKDLLSRQTVDSHCSLITMGLIPTLKSNKVSLAVQQFTKFDGASDLANLAQLQNAVASDMQTVESAAAAARTGTQMVSMQTAKIKSALSGLSNIDDKQNEVLDINSLMTAMDDYVTKAATGNLGVPVNFYLNPISKSQLAQLWMDKYYPNSRYLKIAGDDSAVPGAKK